MMQGCPFPLTMVSDYVTATCVLAIQVPVFSLDESGNPPSSSVHKLKNADLMFFWGFDWSIWEVSFQSKQNKNPKPHCQMLHC